MENTFFHAYCTFPVEYTSTTEAQPDIADSDSDAKDIKYYSTNSLYLLEDFIHCFIFYVDHTDIFNKVIKGTPIPQHRKHFFLERCHKPIYSRWILFFKYLLRFYQCNEIADLLYQGFHSAGLKKEYLHLAVQSKDQFLWPPGNNIVKPNCEPPCTLDDLE